MVYVFGWNIPIFDFMFLLLAILTGSVILVWVELTRLRRLILAEKQIHAQGKVDLMRLESDLNKLESKGKKKKHLHEFVKDSLAKGAKRGDLENALAARGWDKKKVEEAFAMAK